MVPISEIIPINSPNVSVTHGKYLPVFFMSCTRHVNHVLIFKGLKA
jgi:hypothetical protein